MHVNFILVNLFGVHLLSDVEIYSGYIEVYFMIALLDCVFVRYNEDFVIWRFCFIHFIEILAGLKKIVCYTEAFVT